MTQVTSPWHARAFQLRAAARYAAVGVTGPRTAAGALRQFRVTATNFGLFVREPSGLEMEIRLKWLLETMRPYLTHTPPWAIAKRLRDMVKFRRHGAPIVLSRAQIDFFSKPRVTRVPRAVPVAATPSALPPPQQPAAAVVEQGRAPFIDWSEDWETAWDAVERP